jgi:hypothetical protein
LAERREGEVVGIEVVAEVLQEVGGVLVEVSYWMESFYALSAAKDRCWYL